MTDDGMPGVKEALDEALMETHHLANLSNLDEARLARRRLVEAQSASSVERTRDRLEQAIEYLELARLERRDTAAGFVQARELVSYAEAGLRRERPVPLTGSPLELVQSEPEPERRQTLQELRAEAAVNSFDQLQYDVELQDTFDEMYRQVNAGEIDHEPADDGDLDPDAALELASLEMDIERTIQRPDDDSAFEFVEGEELEPPGDDSSPADDETTPAADGTVPEDDAGTPDEGSVDSEETPTPEDDSVPPEDGITIPHNDIARPGDDVTGEDETASQDDITIQEGDIAIPDDDDSSESDEASDSVAGSEAGELDASTE